MASGNKHRRKNSCYLDTHRSQRLHRLCVNYIDASESRACRRHNYKYCFRRIEQVSIKTSSRNPSSARKCRAIRIRSLEAFHYHRKAPNRDNALNISASMVARRSIILRIPSPCPCCFLRPPVHIATRTVNGPL